MQPQQLLVSSSQSDMLPPSFYALNRILLVYSPLTKVRDKDKDMEFKALALHAIISNISMYHLVNKILGNMEECQ